MQTDWNDFMTKLGVSDNDLGKHINMLYRNRKLKVQEAMKRKKQLFQMKQFNDKCIHPKSKMKGFWNCIKGHNYGRDRHFLFLLGRFLKIFSSETAWPNEP